MKVPFDRFYAKRAEVGALRVPGSRKRRSLRNGLQHLWVAPRSLVDLVIEN